MTKSLPKLVLSPSRDIPFCQLVLSQKNVRRVKAGLSIEDLAEDIYRRTLLQSINVRPVLDADGKETGMFEVPAGGRRFRALELLVSGDKIVLISTHDPLLALRGDRRLVIRNGGIAEIIETSQRERDNLARIEAFDQVVMDIRDRLRRGQRIEEEIAWPH